MSKEEYAEKDHEHPWLSTGTIIGFSIAVALFLIILILPNNLDDMLDRIDLLEEEISSMPHYECWNETITETIEVETYDKGYSGEDLWLFGGHSVYIGSSRMANSRIMCDEDISIYEYLGELVNYGSETRLCFIEEVREVCLFNKHDVLLGADE